MAPHAVKDGKGLRYPGRHGATATYLSEAEVASAYRKHASTGASDGTGKTAVEQHRRITEVTRRRLFDALRKAGTDWSGSLDEVSFLRRLYDLHALESTDSRFPAAEGDIIQHRYNNPEDWEDDWVFTDPRFQLNDGPDNILLRFLAEMIHPAVRTDDKEVEQLLALCNNALAPDGYRLAPVTTISGYPVYEARQIAAHARTSQPVGSASETSDAESRRPPGTGRRAVGTPVQETAALSEPLPDVDREAVANQALALTERRGTEVADEDTRAGDLPAPSGEHAAVQLAARGTRKDYAMDRVRMKEGGQADIFAATHTTTGARVALKRRRSHRETPAARMRREIDVAADLIGCWRA